MATIQYLVDGSTSSDVERWFDCPSHESLDSATPELAIAFLEGDDAFQDLVAHGEDFDNALSSLHRLVSGFLDVEQIAVEMEEAFQTYVHREMAVIAHGKYEDFKEWLETEHGL